MVYYVSFHILHSFEVCSLEHFVTRLDANFRFVSVPPAAVAPTI